MISAALWQMSVAIVLFTISIFILFMQMWKKMLLSISLGLLWYKKLFIIQILI